MAELSRHDSYPNHKGWLALWDAQVPNKKDHIRRLIANGLVVGSRLSHRHLSV
jgi:hypothetical protein